MSFIFAFVNRFLAAVSGRPGTGTIYPTIRARIQTRNGTGLEGYECIHFLERRVLELQTGG